jgi:guanine deaminase
MSRVFLNEAARLARHGMRQGDGGPFGAVLVRDGEIVGRGWNRVLLTRDPTAHAEVVAIRDACAALGRFHLEDCDLYATCEPCPMCLGAIYWARLRAVWYAGTRRDAAAAGFSDASIYEELAVSPAARTIPFRRLRVPGVARLFAEWRDMPCKTPY